MKIVIELTRDELREYKEIPEQMRTLQWEIQQAREEIDGLSALTNRIFEYLKQTRGLIG